VKLGIGTAQFGMDYGISNPGGKTSPEEARAIISLARENGIDVIDTAHGYGDSEATLGMILPSDRPFRIITKTPGFPGRPIRLKDGETLKKAFENSLAKLRQEAVYGLLVHSADDLLSPGGHLLFAALQELKDNGLVNRIGASVYTGEQIDQILARYNIDLIELPINALDTRLIASGRLAALKQRAIEIHARSLFLQGLLLMEPEQVHSYFDPVKPVLRSYHSFLRTNGLTPVEGAFCFIKKIPEIDYVIIGVNSRKHLEVNLQAFGKKYDEKLFDRFNLFSLDEPRYLNPALWRVA
jgi:aryl-alcohol dehydrogenase-like predicted oxidoreductase